MKRSLFLILSVIALFGGELNAGVIAFGFTTTTYYPADFQHSTVLSLAFDPSGNLFASNGLNLSTVPLDGSASVSESLRPPIANNQATNDIIFDSSGNLYISDFGTANPILRRPSGGSFTEFATGLDQVREFAFDNNGNLLVIGGGGSSKPGYIKRVTSSGAVTTLVSSILEPWDIDVASDGTIFWATLSGDIFTVSDSGTTTLFASVDRPNLESMVVGPDDFLFVGTSNGSVGGINTSSLLRISQSGDVDVLVRHPVLIVG